MSELSTHSKFIAHLLEQLKEKQKRGEVDLGSDYEYLAQALVESRPQQLREFVENLDLDDCGVAGPLLALAWRIVGNEYSDDPDVVNNASRALVKLISGGVKNASEAFGDW